jgi:hypothetical protein
MTNTTAPAVIFTREQAKASDATLVELQLAVARAQQKLTNELRWLRDSVSPSTGYGSKKVYELTTAQAEARNAEIAATDTSYVGRQAQDRIVSIAAAREALRDAIDAATVQGREWAEHGRWNRYSVVPGGHIHTDLDDCHTFRYGPDGTRTTDVRWAYPVSGDSVEEAIETYGPALCTHCFPEAPVVKTSAKVETDVDGNPITKAQADAARAARQAEKQAKLDAKNAKRVIDPSTGTWVEYDRRELKTEVAVRNQILSLLEDIHYYGDGTGAFNRGETRSEAAARLIAALAVKQGRDAEELASEFRAKAAKKFNRH